MINALVALAIMVPTLEAVKIALDIWLGPAKGVAGAPSNASQVLVTSYFPF